MREIHLASKCTYGSRRMLIELRKRRYTVGRYRVRRLMKQAQLVLAKGLKHYYPKLKGAEAHVAPNLLERRFNPDKPNAVWASDITYVRTKQGWFYVVIVMDLYARRIVGRAFSNQPDTELVLAALEQALASRQWPVGVMFHSDQGCQYTSVRFVQTLAKHGLVQSMSRKGNCWDNAVVERFFRSLKSERIGEQIYETHEQARDEIAQYIDHFYNYQRIHSAADDLPPVLHEAAFLLKSPLDVSINT
jgi:putative transposase